MAGRDLGEGARLIGIDRRGRGYPARMVAEPSVGEHCVRLGVEPYR